MAAARVPTVARLVVDKPDQKVPSALTAETEITALTVARPAVDVPDQRVPAVAAATATPQWQ